MSLWSRAIIAMPGKTPAVVGGDLRELLEPAGLLPPAAWGSAQITAWQVEGDHARLDLHFDPPDKGFAILLRPLDDGAGYRKGKAWVISYRGQGFEAADGLLLEATLARLEAATAARGWSAQDLRFRYFTRPVAGDTLEVSPGKKLYIRVTDHCDEACVFCNATEGNANVVPSRHTVEEILRDLPAGSLSQVIFTGGEPTLIKSLPRMVFLAYERGAKEIIIQTNGVFFAQPGTLEPYLPFIDRLGLGFSLHARQADLSAVMVNHADTKRFSAKIAAIDAAVALGFRVKITCVVMRPNVEQIPDFARFCWERWGQKLTRLQFSYAMPRGNAWLNRHLLLRFSDMVPPLQAAFAYGRDVGLPIETSQTACLPPCLMPNEIEQFDVYGDFSGGATSDPDRVKPPGRCQGCNFDRLCAGVWQRYIDVFGDAELQAVTDRPDPGTPVDDYLEAELLAADGAT